jgi:hypothetical protein
MGAARDNSELSRCAENFVRRGVRQKNLPMTENFQNAKRFPAWANWLAFAVCLLPPVALAVLLRRNAVDVPYWDEWDDDLAGIFLKWHNGNLHFGDFWAQHNESRLALPRAVFLLLGGFAHWNILRKVAFSFCLATGAATAIFLLGRKTFAGSPIKFWTAFFITSLLMFSPAQWQAWLWGMELVMYLPLVFILAAVLTWQTGFSPRAKIIFAGIMALAAACSFSNGLLAWIALFPLVFLSEGLDGLKKQSRAALLWLLAFLANVAVYLQNYQAPPSPSFWRVLCNNPLRVAEYLLAFLGNPLVNQNSDRAVTAGITIGGAELALFVFVCGAVFFRRKNPEWTRRVWPWLTLGGYGILSALLAMTGRAAFGAQQALSPRYGIFGVCLAVSLVFLVPLVLASTTQKQSWKIRSAFAALGGIVIGLHALAWPAAVANLQLFSLNLRHAQVCLKFLDVLPPQPATLATLCPNFEKVKNMADALDRAGVLDYRLLQTARLADFKKLSPCDKTGAIETSQIAGTNLFLAGWAWSAENNRPADCVVFTCETTNREPQIFVLMDSRPVRANLTEKFHDQNYLLAGWQKNCPLAELPKGAVTVRAWRFDAQTGLLAPLANEVHVDNR